MRAAFGYIDNVVAIQSEIKQFILIYHKIQGMSWGFRDGIKPESLISITFCVEFGTCNRARRQGQAKILFVLV